MKKFWNQHKYTIVAVITIPWGRMLFREGEAEWALWVSTVGFCMGLISLLGPIKK